MKRARGEMPAHRRFGKLTVYRYADVLDWIESTPTQFDKRVTAADPDQTLNDELLGRKRGRPRKAA